MLFPDAASQTMPEDLNIPALKKQCKANGLKVTGNKQELLDRLHSGTNDKPTFTSSAKTPMHKPGEKDFVAMATPLIMSVKGVGPVQTQGIASTMFKNGFTLPTPNVIGGN
eukprot:7380564-Prymnesium_polylepis.2